MNHITDSVDSYMHHEIKKSFSHTRMLITQSGTMITETHPGDPY